MGFLMRHARTRGWDAIGVEPSPTLAKIAREQFNHTVHNCFLNEMPHQEHHSFDVVALSDVFEHITQPLEFLADAARLLKPDGILYVKVPNARWNLWKQGVLARLGKRPVQGLWDSTSTSSTTPTPR
jgi:2-polyprenyl-3-methyl-5-hydroxy-6-metoxy-1,4-benzoquinol methylase